jgi:tRNA G46 methylase TrmB
MAPRLPNTRYVGVEPSGRAVEDLTHRCAMLGQLSTGGLDVVRDEQEPLL